jgi:hypothetical protein
LRYLHAGLADLTDRIISVWRQYTRARLSSGRRVSRHDSEKP